MSDDTEPRRVFLGSFDGGTTALIIPHQTLARANAELDRERVRREKEIAQLRVQALGDARARGKFAKALRMLLHRGRRP